MQNTHEVLKSHPYYHKRSMCPPSRGRISGVTREKQVETFVPGLNIQETKNIF